MDRQDAGPRHGHTALPAAQVVRISTMLSKTLRHDPGRVGLTLDEGGWVDVDRLLAAFAQRGTVISPDELACVVATNDKQRFALRDGRIRANQGHSIEVDLGLEPLAPPAVLFHGTGAGSVDSILATGIHPGSRQQVHLSADRETARTVGARHGPPVVLEVAAGPMHEAGIAFSRSQNGVWLVDAVPARYVRRPPG